MNQNSYWVYIITNTTHSVFYIGVTNDIKRRLFEHRLGMMEGYTKRYKLHKLIYLEQYENIEEAVAREKELKDWRKSWSLIRSKNPELDDVEVN